MRIGKRRDIIYTFLLLLLSAALFIVPTGFERQIYVNAEGAKALVLDTDDSTVIQTGLFRSGEQRVRVRLISGLHEGTETDAVNMLSGSLADDKMFVAGDVAWVLVEMDEDGNLVFVNMIDHYRIGKEILLISALLTAIILFSGLRGFRTILSFVFAFLMLWKVLIPFCLEGVDPMLVSALTLCLIATSTLLLIAGLEATGISSLIGTVVTMLLTLLLSDILTSYFSIHGSILPQSESILYAGFLSLDLTRLFSSVIVLSAGGAIMDLSIDVAISMKEVYLHAPDIKRRDLFRSGLAVGRSGVGTQMTTLLLAYMGSFLTVMMVYMAQGTPCLNVLTSKSMAGEILQSAVGMFSLLIVTPVTALVASYLLTGKNKLKITSR